MYNDRKAKLLQQHLSTFHCELKQKLKLHSNKHQQYIATYFWKMFWNFLTC